MSGSSARPSGRAMGRVDPMLLVQGLKQFLAAVSEAPSIKYPSSRQA
jgi:hypothetical protein